MTPEQVSEILGEPDEKEREEYSKDDPSFFTEEWHYDEIELSLSFDMLDKMELSTISVSSADYALSGKKLIGLKRAEVEALIGEMGLHAKWEEFKEIDVNSNLLSNEEEGLSLWYEGGVLTEISWESL